MKKMLSLLLCLCTVITLLTVFASCSKKGEAEPKVSKKTIEVDLTDYSIVCGSDLTSHAQTHANQIATTLRDLTAIPMKVSVDKEGEPTESADNEILIGNTTRPETAKALKSLGDCGWAIRVYEGKIVIVGTNSFMTRVALDYFARNYLTAHAVKGEKITLPKSVVLAKLTQNAFVNEAGEGQYVLVYDDWVDDKDDGAKYDYGRDANPDGGPQVDYTFSVVTDIQKQLVAITKAKSSTFPTKLASSDVENEYEILVGNMSRDDVKGELNQLDVNEYGVVIRGNKIMILGWNDLTLTHAYTAYQDLIESCTVVDEAGNQTCLIPTAGAVIGSLNADAAWYTDFPKPEGDGIQLHGTEDVGEGSVEYIYTGDGVTADAYTA